MRMIEITIEKEIKPRYLNFSILRVIRMAMINQIAIRLFRKIGWTLMKPERKLLIWITFESMTPRLLKMSIMFMIIWKVSLALPFRINLFRS